MNSSQQLITTVLNMMFVNSEFILSILYTANINCFFERPKLFGMSLDKNNLSPIALYQGMSETV